MRSLRSLFSIALFVSAVIPAAAQQWVPDSSTNTLSTTSRAVVGTSTIPIHATMAVASNYWTNFYIDSPPAYGPVLRFSESGGATSLAYFGSCGTQTLLNCTGGPGALQIQAERPQAPLLMYSGPVLAARFDHTGLYIPGSITVDGNVNAKFQDLAEWVPSTEPLDAGTVVVLSKSANNTVKRSAESYDTRVAGVVSANPGVILGHAGPDKVQVATTGRVKVHVDATSAPIEIGDLLVTSDKPGFAMKSEPLELRGRSFHQPGTIIGKALEPLDKGTGEILVLLSLQ